jgi:hypothetical protein
MGAMRVCSLAVLLLFACSEGEDSGDSRAYVGTGPELSRCFAGYAFAECGGDDPPRLACRLPAPEEGAVPVCMWFTGGRVAEGFLATGCEDLCCRGPNPGGWPFDYPEDGDLALHVADFFFAWGLSPWDRAREVVLVPEIDGSLSPLPEPELLVLGEAFDVADGGNFPRVVVTRALRDTLTVVASFQNGYGGESWMLEVIETDEGPRARVCMFLATDAHVLACDGYQGAGARCAHDATITLSRMPQTEQDLEGLAVHVEAQLDDGTTVELSL